VCDIKAEDWNEKWVSDDRDLNPTALLTAAEIAERFGLSRHDIQNWSHRHPDKVPVRGKRGNRNLYMVRDVLLYRSKKPTS
jgi:hypothetical protein